MFKTKKFFIYLIILITLTVGFSGFAADLSVDWPNSPGGTSLSADSTLGTLIKYVYEWLVSLGGLAAFVILVIAGIQYLTSSGNPTKINEAKDKIQSAVLGLVLLLGSVVILKIINPELINLKEVDFDFYEELPINCLEMQTCVDDTGRGKPCSGTAFCRHEFGDNYKCQNGLCRIDLSQVFKVNHCKSVRIYVNGKSLSDELKMGKKSTFLDIEEGSEISIVPIMNSGDEFCLGTLVLTQGALCGGKVKTTVLIQPGLIEDFSKGIPTVILSENELNHEVKCIKLERIN